MVGRLVECQGCALVVSGWGGGKGRGESSRLNVDVLINKARGMAVRRAKGRWGVVRWWKWGDAATWTAVDTLVRCPRGGVTDCHKQFHAL